MREERVSPNLLTYSTLIDAYSKGGLYREAMEVFREFKRAGLKADVVLYSELINALCKAGMVESAVSLLDEMTREGVMPNVVTYNSIIDAFGRPSIAKEGSSSSLSMVKMFGRLAVDKEGKAAKKFEFEGRREIMCILGVFRKMHELNIKPNVVTFSAILNACRSVFFLSFYYLVRIWLECLDVRWAVGATRSRRLRCCWRSCGWWTSRCMGWPTGC